MLVICTCKLLSLKLYYLGGIIYVCMCMYMYNLGGNIHEIDSPMGAIGSRNVHSPGYPLGPLVPWCAMQWWPTFRVNMYTSVVTNVPS